MEVNVKFLSKIGTRVERLFIGGAKDIGKKQATNSEVTDFLRVLKKKDPVGYDQYIKGAVNSIKEMPDEKYNRLLQTIRKNGDTTRLGYTELFNSLYKDIGDGAKSWKEMIGFAIKHNNLPEKTTLNKFTEYFINKNGYSEIA